MVRGIVGYELHPNVAIEGMLAFGVSDDSITENVSGIPVSLKAEIQNAYGLFVKPKFNVSDSLELFGRIGYSRFKTKATASAPGFGSVSATDSDSDLSYGLGATYNFSKSSFATIDYMNYYNKDGVKGTGLTIGVGYRF
jgi:opacity protein-like surface antigen